MFTNKPIIHIIAFVGLLNFGYAFTDEATQEISLAKHISNRYLTSTFGNIPIITPIEKPTAPEGVFAQIKRQLSPDIEKLSDREVQEIAFHLDSMHYTYNTTIIDNSFIDKLEVIGGGENSQEHIFGRLFNNSINTAMGKSHTALTLCHPITDISTLRNRQKAIAHLSQHKPYTEKINSALEKIATVEIKSLMPWTTKHLVRQELLAASYFKRFINIGGIANTNTFALELFASRYPLILFSSILTFGPPAVILCGIELARRNNNTINGINNSYWHTTKACGNSIVQLIKDPSISPSYKVGGPVIEAYLLFFSYIFSTAIKSNADMHKHLQDGLIAVSSHVKELKKLSSLIRKDKCLLQSLPSLKPLADFNDTTKHSARFNKLLRMLDTNTFKGKASFWSITGRVLAAYELMKHVKDELAPAFAAAGELDMYVALAKLYNEREGKVARYCMVNFIENSTTPIIDAKNFWNPFINPDTVVVNNATFDVTQPNSILTGPNTGGKSTVIKGIMINALMAQTFGIAPSESLTITPFAKLNCFMNISDDIATGASLFKSEVMRAKKLLDMVQALQPHELSFVIIDEVFTGTSPVEGEAAALRFAKRLGLYTNNTSIIATHYPKMVDLEVETSGTYRNNHVEILRNEDESLNRTFKLKSGPSFFNVAFDILEEEGLFV